MHKNGPGSTGWALKSALAALPRLEIEPLFPAHGALLSLISGPNATTDNFETASNPVQVRCELNAIDGQRAGNHKTMARRTPTGDQEKCRR